MRSETEIVSTINELFDQERKIMERQNAAETDKERSYLLAQRQRLVEQRQALNWVLEETDLIGMQT